MIKQYVNLPQDPAEHHGADLPLEVEASNVSADNVRYAEWWIEPNGDNTPERYLSRRQRAHLQQRITRNRRDHFANTLSLPHVGGDRYDIKCSKRNDRNSAVTIDTVETWRKLFFPFTPWMIVARPTSTVSKLRSSAPCVTYSSSWWNINP